MAGQVERCFEVLELLAGAANGLGLTVIANRLELSKSAAHRLLAILVERGFVAQEAASERYGLTFRLPMLGVQYLSLTKLTDVTRPVLERVAAATGELVRLTIRDGDRLSWAAKAQGARSGLVYDPEMGREARLFCTATGHAFLAALAEEEGLRLVLQQGFALGTVGPEAPSSLAELRPFVEAARRKGYAVVYDSGTAGTAAAAAAIRTGAGGTDVVGTISIAGPTARLTRDGLERFAREQLVPAARELAAVWPLQRYLQDWQPVGAGRLRGAA
jgi:DNA-binding IclR family transcriptional regulator